MAVKQGVYVEVWLAQMFGSTNPTASYTMGTKLPICTERTELGLILDPIALTQNLNFLGPCFNIHDSLQTMDMIYHHLRRGTIYYTA